MSDSAYLVAALGHMYERGYSLVKIQNGWSLAETESVPNNPKLDQVVVSAGGVVRAGRWATPLEALLEIGRRVTPRDPKPAPSGSVGIVKITKEQYEAMRALIIKDAGDEKLFTATKSLALDGLMQMSYCFGASSTDYITLYPSIG